MAGGYEVSQKTEEPFFFNGGSRKKHVLGAEKVHLREVANFDVPIKVVNDIRNGWEKNDLM